MSIFGRKPKPKFSPEPAGGKAAATQNDAAAELHLRIMVEQMVREGRSAQAIEAAVRRAA